LLSQLLFLLLGDGSIRQHAVLGSNFKNLAGIHEALRLGQSG
jgi:hypothetical protein